jgi:hypothetical protein
MDNHEEHDKQAKEQIIKDVKEYGCHLALLETDGYSPAFVYSIGLFENYKHPEIVIFGLPINTMGSIINGIKDQIQNGTTFKTDINYSDVLNGFDVQFIEVDKENYPDYFGYGGWYYNKNFDFPVLQLIWPDKEAKLPWDNNFNSDWKFKQPLLDRNTDFKFLEETNLGVYTTKHTFEGNPILEVYHNEDGDWQFFTESGADLESAKLVSLKSLVDMDKTLNSLHYMNYGTKAYRNSINNEWTIEEAIDQKEKE